MMEYQVPQFVDVEDKIFGPFSWKQFVYLAGGAGICVGLILYLPLFLGLLLAVPIGGLSAALAFYKVNGKPFIEILEAGFEYLMKNRLYLWKKDTHTVEELAILQAKQAAMAPPEAPVRREKLSLSSGKLKDLAMSLDIKTGNEEPL